MTDPNTIPALAQQLTAMLQGTANFTVGQAPDVIRQVLQWTLIEDGIILVICIGVLWGLVEGNRWAFKEAKKNKDFELFLLFILDLVGIIPLVLAIGNIMEMLEIYIAPKAFLLDYLRHLLSK